MEVQHNGMSSCSENHCRNAVQTKRYPAVNTSQYVAHRSVGWKPHLRLSTSTAGSGTANGH